MSTIEVDEYFKKFSEHYCLAFGHQNGTIYIISKKELDANTRVFEAVNAVYGGNKQYLERGEFKVAGIGDLTRYNLAAICDADVIKLRTPELDDKQKYFEKFYENCIFLHHTSASYVIANATCWKQGDKELNVIVAKTGGHTTVYSRDCAAVSRHSVPSHLLDNVYKKDMLGFKGTTPRESISESKSKFLLAFYPFRIVKYRNGAAYYYVSAETAEKVKNRFRNHSFSVEPVDIVHGTTMEGYEANVNGLILIEEWNEIAPDWQRRIVEADIYNLNLKGKLMAPVHGSGYSTGNASNYNSPVKSSTQPKQDTVMNNPLGNLQFGKIKSSRLALSMLGIAILQDEGGYVSYNASTGELTDVGDFIFKMEDAFFLVPAPELKAGDLIKEGEHFCFVTDINDDGSYTVVGKAGIEYKKLVKNNLFGIQFFAKVVSMWDMLSGQTDQSPFSVGGTAFNPLMFAMMSSKEGGSSDMLTMLMLQQFMVKPVQKPAAPAKKRSRK